jgi:hypothetical protein
VTPRVPDNVALVAFTAARVVVPVTAKVVPIVALVVTAREVPAVKVVPEARVVVVTREPGVVIALGRLIVMAPGPLVPVEVICPLVPRISIFPAVGVTVVLPSDRVLKAPPTVPRRLQFDCRNPPTEDWERRVYSP